MVYAATGSSVHTITGIFHECYRISKHWQLDCLHNNLFRLTRKNMKDPYFWIFVKGIHQWPVDTPQKGQVMWKAFLGHDFIIQISYSPTCRFFGGVQILLNTHGSKIHADYSLLFCDSVTPFKVSVQILCFSFLGKISQMVCQVMIQIM